MGKYIVLKPIYEADQRHEKGSVIDLTEERAAQVGAEYVAPEVPEEAPAVPTAPASPVEGVEGEETSEGEEAEGDEESNEE